MLVNKEIENYKYLQEKMENELKDKISENENLVLEIKSLKKKINNTEAERESVGSSCEDEEVRLNVLILFFNSAQS